MTQWLARIRRLVNLARTGVGNGGQMRTESRSPRERDARGRNEETVGAGEPVEFLWVPLVSALKSRVWHALRTLWARMKACGRD